MKWNKLTDKHPSKCTVIRYVILNEEDKGDILYLTHEQTDDDDDNRTK